MITKSEVREMFDAATEGAEPDGTKYFVVHMPKGSNPFVDLAGYATADLRVTQLGSDFFAATVGTLDASVATELED